MNGRPILFGEVLFDRFPDGSVVLGGAPFNVAWNLQALGLSPLLISRIGDDDLGDRILAAMESRGMAIDGIQRDRRHPTGTVEVSLQDGQPGVRHRHRPGVRFHRRRRNSPALKAAASSTTAAWPCVPRRPVKRSRRCAGQPPEPS